jgi:tRNA-Thr(GGU) m(6)t(6)A37 methyltransferase TsaA
MKNTPKPIQFQPIGYFSSTQIEPYQAARQPDENSEPGIIQLNPGQNFEQALTDLSGCSHIWIIYQFHHNENWKPLVLTPRSEKKIGVFATRAPYRPNPIGMTVVRVINIDGLNIYVGPNDLLNETPILDIKPYHPESDLISDAKIDWLDSNLKKYKIQFSPVASEQFDFLSSSQAKEIKPFVLRQLEYDPINSDKKRVSKENGFWALAYRTWRIDFILIEDCVSVIGIRSGYTEAELIDETDTYLDKNLHRKFIENYQ